MAQLLASANDRNGRPPPPGPGDGGPLKVDWVALACAVLLELVLLVLAAFGGPHGQLGVIPWILQLPGILLVVYPPDGSFFAARVGAGALLQAGLWYTALRLIRRRGSRPAR